MEANDMKAMREALEYLLKQRDILDFCHNNLGSKTWEDWDKVYNALRKAIEKAMCALAKPPRNCDLFNDLNSAQRHYVEHGCPKGLGMVVDGEIRKAPWKSQFEKWLFAPRDGAEMRS